MATFRAGKLARKKNGRFLSTAVKSRTENLLDSRKRKSSDSLADAIKVSFQSERSAKAKPCYRGGVLLSSVCFPNSLMMVAIIVKDLYSSQTVGEKLYLDFPYISLWESFHRRKRAPGDLLMRRKK